MAISVTKNAKESTDRLIARFNKLVQSSRVLLLAREKKYFKKPLRKWQIRDRAIMRDQFRKQRDKMKYY